MSWPNRATEILEAVFSRNDGNDAGPLRNRVHTLFFAVPGKLGLRWIVPAASSLGKSVLREWRPYSLLSQLKWEALISAYSVGLLGRMPGIQSISLNLNRAIQIPGTDSLAVPVVYVGTPGSQQKAVATLVSSSNGQPRAVMKVALSEEAKDSLKREALTLKKLASASALAAPKLLTTEKSGNRTWQTVISGSLSSRKLTQVHIDWLLQLPRFSETLKKDDLQEQLILKFKNNPKLLDDWNSILHAVFSRIKELNYPTVLVHGDFVPWNLKIQKNNNIAAIDWEDSDWSGLPLWDLCHFFLIQSHLFRERNPVRRMINSPLVQQYAQRISIDRKEIVPLTLLYSLVKASGLRGSCNESYRNYLFSQIPLILSL